MEKNQMKALLTTLFAGVAAAAYAAGGEPSVVVLQDQHGNYNTMFVRSEHTRTSIALSVKGQGATSRHDYQNAQQQDYGQTATTQYRSR